MTCNPARLLAEADQARLVDQTIGPSGRRAQTNITIVNPKDKIATYTLVNGVIASFENRTLRGGSGAGYWVCKFGLIPRTGLGDLAMFVRQY